MGTECFPAQPQQSAADSSADSAEAEIERLLESDPALVPDGPSQFVVAAPTSSIPSTGAQPGPSDGAERSASHGARN